jgi:hypothetical protein
VPVENLKWVSPITIIVKKNGKFQVCVDYQRLNDCTKKDYYPFPFIDDILDEIAGHELYSFGDGYSGYTKSNMGWRLWKRQRQLKHLKIEGIALKRPDFNGTKMVLNRLYVDVSNIVVATLSRLADKGQDHPICYVSRQFIPIEQNYVVTE